MEIVNFFFNDFWHFIMLLLICWSLSPKINISSNSPVTWGNSKPDKNE